MPNMTYTTFQFEIFCSRVLKAGELWVKCDETRNFISRDFTLLLLGESRAIHSYT